jgi:tripartite-type tricarboxylate transporter receptor subunit TctC
MLTRALRHLRHVALIITLCVGALACATVMAQSASWPTRAVRLIVGFPGGSTPDTAARTLAEGLAKVWGRPVVVEAKVGASGNIAADAVAKANDDHTLGVVINGNLTTSKLLNPKLSFDPAKDLLLLSLIATSPLVLVAPADMPSGASWISAVRAAGDKLSYGSVGVGSVGHLGIEVILSAIGNPGVVHVPYNSNPAIITAMLGGQVHMALMPPAVAMPQVKAGKLQAVGLTGPRSAMAPEVPALTELGVRMNALEVWVALVAPSHLSRAAQERVAHDLPALLKETDTRQRLRAGGWEPVGSSSVILVNRVREETRMFGDIIAARGIRLD